MAYPPTIYPAYWIEMDLLQKKKKQIPHGPLVQQELYIISTVFSNGVATLWPSDRKWATLFGYVRAWVRGSARTKLYCSK
jgi:hypothetical protein